MITRLSLTCKPNQGYSEAQEGIVEGFPPLEYRKFHSFKELDFMVVLGYFLTSIASLLDLVLMVYMYILIIGALLSWVNPDPYNPIVRFVHTVTEPVLGQVRRYLPVMFSGIDFSPVVVILVIYFLRGFVVRSLMHVGARLMY